jgi:hypothetical protein
MKKAYTLFFLVLLISTLLLLVRCTYNKDDKDNYANANLSPDSLCFVNPSWFPHSQTPAPEEGIGSPFDTSSTTNQIFHQWSWNKFLWLTKPDAGGNPLFLNQAKVIQVTSYMQRVKQATGAMLVLQDIHQAGSASAILRTNPGYNGGTKNDTVFYSIHTNPTMLHFADSIIAKGMPDSNNITFPVGSFEMKVAWVPITSIPAAKLPMYYTTTASLSRDSGRTFTNTKVAMVGMHIVGVVQNHPEFIWATFEHNDLAPNYDWKANSASAATDKLLFKTGSVTGIDGIVYDKSTGLGKKPYQVFDLFRYGVPKTPTDSFMATSQQEPINFNNIDGINQCVQSQLKDVWSNYFYNGSLWLNMDGTTPARQAFIIDSLGYAISNCKPGGLARGSMNCSNVTMETFTQTFKTDISQVNVSTLANCFSCHSPVTFKKGSTARSPLYLSHIFQDYLLSKKGNTVEAVEKMKLETEKVIQSRAPIQ